MPHLMPDIPPPGDDPLDIMASRAADAAAFLKALSHEGRLMILCHITEAEKSVTELEDLLGARQSAVSQHLARLRIEGLVTARREGKTMYYAIADDRVRETVRLMYRLFCGAGDGPPAGV
jgi:DNA-binding transcriptional ArsR family regulator